MSKPIPRLSTIKAAIDATEKKITNGYEKSWRFANSYEQEQMNVILNSIHKGEHDILQKLKTQFEAAKQG